MWYSNDYFCLLFFVVLWIYTPRISYLGRAYFHSGIPIWLWKQNKKKKKRYEENKETSTSSLNSYILISVRHKCISLQEKKKKESHSLSTAFSFLKADFVRFSHMNYVFFEITNHRFFTGGRIHSESMRHRSNSYVLSFFRFILSVSVYFFFSFLLISLLLALPFQP